MIRVLFVTSLVIFTIFSCSGEKSLRNEPDHSFTEIRVVAIETLFSDSVQSNQDTVSVMILDADRRLLSIRQYENGILQVTRNNEHFADKTIISIVREEPGDSNEIYTEYYYYSGGKVNVYSLNKRGDTIRNFYFTINDDQNILRLNGFSIHDGDTIAFNQKNEYDSSGNLVREEPGERTYENRYVNGKLKRQVVRGHNPILIGSHNFEYRGDTIIDSYYGPFGTIQTKTYTSESNLFHYLYNYEKQVFREEFFEGGVLTRRVDYYLSDY